MGSKAAAQAVKQLRVGIIGEYTCADAAEGTSVRNTRCLSSQRIAHLYKLQVPHQALLQVLAATLSCITSPSCRLFLASMLSRLPTGLRSQLPKPARSLESMR